MKDDIELLIQEGEGYKTEFKESISRLDREMCAFANASGGTLYVGITDKGKVKPHKLDNRSKSKIIDTARNCDPPISVSVKQVGDVIKIEVPEGDNKPYGCASGFYLRVGPNSQKMKTWEIINMITSENRILFDGLVNREFDYKDLDISIVSSHFKKAGVDVSGRVDDVLCNLSLAKRDRKKIYLTNGGVLLFSNDPTRYIFSSMVTCVRYKGTTKYKIIDRKDFKGNIMEQVEDCLKFISRNTRVEYVITGEPARKEIPEYPLDVIREAVINAVIHRDYFDKKMVTQVDIYDDRIEITNPGGLVKGLTIEDLGKTAIHRNPLLVDFFHRIGWIEKIGSGIVRMREGMREAGHPEPEFDVSNIYFRIILHAMTDVGVRDVVSTAVSDAVTTKEFRENFSVNFRENFSVKGKQLDRMVEMIIRLASGRYLIVSELANEFIVSTRTIHEDLRRLERWDVIKFEGPPKTGRYVLTEKGKKVTQVEKPTK